MRVLLVTVGAAWVAIVAYVLVGPTTGGWDEAAVALLCTGCVSGAYVRGVTHDLWQYGTTLRCGSCGYSLEGLESLRCPECGHDRTVAPFPTWRLVRQPWRRLSRLGLLLFLACSLLLAILVVAQ